MATHYGHTLVIASLSNIINQATGNTIPSFKELGYPDIVAEVSFYLMAAKGTPQPIVDKLYRAAEKALQNPTVKEAFRKQGIDDRRGGPAELSAYLTGELRRWGEIVKLSAAK